MSDKTIDWSKPIRTTCGKPARVVDTNYRPDTDTPRALVVVSRGSYEQVMSSNLSGQNGHGATSFENIPEERWIVEYIKKDGSSLGFGNNVFSSKEKAEKRTVGSIWTGVHKAWRLVDE